MVNYDRDIFGSMDSFLKIAKWSFLKPQEKIQRKIMDLWSEFSTSFPSSFLARIISLLKKYSVKFMRLSQKSAFTGNHAHFSL